LAVNTKSYKFAALLGSFLILASCSVEKNTGTTRFYQSLTSKYNIYFNGYESFKAGMNKIFLSYKDDYSEVLRVFEFSDPSTVSVCSSDMERAVQKASKVITLKSMTARPKEKEKGELTEREREFFEQKEYNQWVDDSYLLIAKARFFKHEFDEAKSVFNYCITQAVDPLIIKEAGIWLARIYNETGNYTEANRLLREMDITTAFPDDLKEMYFTTLTDMFVRQKRYQEAIEPLSKGLEFARGKRSRYRFTYLLAQLNEKVGNGPEATDLYRAVVKMNPPYDVEFNARINLAGVFDISAANPREIEKELEKMLKDTKNKDYIDQIYFTLGNLSKKEENYQEAIEYYKKSIAGSTQNVNQKGKSYLALAEYYFSRPDYIEASMFYDSAIYFLDQKYPDYQTLSTRARNLNALASHISAIRREDSLQKVAAMSETERNTFITAIIEQVKKDEAEGKTSGYTDRYNMGQYYENERRFQGNIDQEGKWYFYNQSALTFGRTEFRRRWGDRGLEDNWRRSNKTRVATAQGDDIQGLKTNGQPDTSKVNMDNKSPGYYLAGLPLNDSLLAISNEKIATAYLNAGKAFSEKINDPKSAEKSFVSLLTRFPNHELVPEALYNLYMLLNKENDPKAETYRQRLLEKYPDIEFSKILSDPAYYKKKMEDQKRAGILYEEAYGSYLKENFSETVIMCDNALKDYSADPLAPKFILLRAYALAKTSDEKTFREELVNLIKQWPDTEESKKASGLIEYLNVKTPELKIEEDKVIAAELYTADTLKPHFFSIIISDNTFNLNQASFDIISYNIDNYTNKNYRTEGNLVDNKYLMITVSGFKAFQDALHYYNSFNPEVVLRNSSRVKITKFLINNDNLVILNKDKNPERYQLFFIEKYFLEEQKK
jgi:tetratricopeptide (TPR) repeat protein